MKRCSDLDRTGIIPIGTDMHPHTYLPTVAEIETIQRTGVDTRYVSEVLKIQAAVIHLAIDVSYSLVDVHYLVLSTYSYRRIAIGVRRAIGVQIPTYITCLLAYSYRRTLFSFRGSYRRMVSAV